METYPPIFSDVSFEEEILHFLEITIEPVPMSMPHKLASCNEYTDTSPKITSSSALLSQMRLVRAGNPLTSRRAIAVCINARLVNEENASIPSSDLI